MKQACAICFDVSKYIIFLCSGGEPVPVVICWSEVKDGELLK